MLEVYRNIASIPTKTVIRTKAYITRKFATVNHIPSLLNRSKNSNLGKMVFETLGHLLLGVLAFQMKSVFFDPIVCRFIGLSRGEWYNLDLGK